MKPISLGVILFFSVLTIGCGFSNCGCATSSSANTNCCSDYTPVSCCSGY